LNTAQASQNQEKNLEILTSRNFQSWLIGQQASLAFTTYEVGKIFMLGSSPEGKLAISERTFNRAMGLGGDTQTLWMSALYQVWRFENALLAGQSYQHYDRVFIPQMAYTTGDLDIHDITMGPEGKPVFVNTLFSCIATVSDTHSFKMIWKPSFISKLAPEDRCHLNGMATENGEPRYVTAVSPSDASDGWRDYRKNGGVVIDVPSNEVICKGLSMPHSPRLYRGNLWMLEAGTGYLGTIDREKGTFERVTFCPGFVRGLSFVGNYAIVGISKIRENRTFSGLDLEENLAHARVEPRCGLQIINLETGDTEHWVRVEGIVNELYDVKVLHNVRAPLVIGTRKEDIQRMVSIEP
jgi:uncharacterized protein (TIGR03032 family)